MRTITKNIKLVGFNELPKDRQDLVINDYINELVETTDFSKLDKHTNLYKAYNKCEELLTPWFIGQYVYEYCEKAIIKELKKYEYLESGAIYNE
jgi:hypothetical protein